MIDEGNDVAVGGGISTGLLVGPRVCDLVSMDKDDKSRCADISGLRGAEWELDRLKDFRSTRLRAAAIPGGDESGVCLALLVRNDSADESVDDEGPDRWLPFNPFIPPGTTLILKLGVGRSVWAYVISYAYM